MNSGDYEFDGRTQADQDRRRAEASAELQQKLLQRQKEIQATDNARRRK